MSFFILLIEYLAFTKAFVQCFGITSLYKTHLKNDMVTFHLHKILQGRYYSHFITEETETHKKEISSLRPSLKTSEGLKSALGQIV